MYKKSFTLVAARQLFQNICNQLSEIKLAVTDVEPEKKKPHLQAATVYLPDNFVNNRQAFASVQYYGGPSKYRAGQVRAVELRFYNRNLSEITGIAACIKNINDYRVPDRKDYIAFQFNNNSSEVKTFIDELISVLKNSFETNCETFAALPVGTVSKGVTDLPHF